MKVTRRTALLYGQTAFGSLLLSRLPTFAADGDVETHGLSTFGELSEAPDFKHFRYVNPNAPKGGEIALTALGSFDSFQFHSDT